MRTKLLMMEYIFTCLVKNKFTNYFLMYSAITDNCTSITMIIRIVLNCIIYLTNYSFIVLIELYVNKFNYGYQC